MRLDGQSGLRAYWISGAATVLAAVVLAGCSGSSFLGRKFDDFTAHYNTFYNASRTFKEQERRIEKQAEKIDLDHYLLVYKVPETRGRSAEFEKVIQKSADLLRKHPESKWVDDALMLIGKSYFYQTNYVGAEQKFGEIINLEGELKDEATFWLGRTLVASKSQQAAEDVIRTALASEQLDDKWRPQLYLLLGDLGTESADWEGAIEALETGLPDTRDGDLAARARFLLGQLYETIERYPEAVASYRAVQKHKPLYELSFVAMYSDARVEGTYGGHEEAIAVLEKMLRDNKHFQYADRIEYSRARVMAASGQPLLARQLYLDILYHQPGRRQTSIRGEVHYRLGALYRDQIGDFYAAAAHFDTASTILRAGALQNERYTPDAIADARAIADVFSTYRDVLEDVQEMDSLLYLGTLDDAAFDSAVTAVRRQLAVKAARVAAELERRQTQSSFRRGAISDEDNAARQANIPARTRRGRFGFLNHKDIQLVQESFLNFRRVWGDRPLVPGWRREEVVLSSRSEQQDEFDRVEGPTELPVSTESQVTFLPPVDISSVPRDSASQAQMKSRRAAARYQLANVLFLSMSLPDSATSWYRLVIEEDSAEPVALRAQYAMAEVHTALGDEEAARSLLMKIVDEHPESIFADRARVSLGIGSVAEAPDSLELAMEQYHKAYRIWNDGDLQLAMDAMVRTAAENPKAEVAAKAMLASAAIFIEMARSDSVDVFGAMPIGDSVFTPAELELAQMQLEAPPTEQDTVVAVALEDSVAEQQAPPPTRRPAKDDVLKNLVRPDTSVAEAVDVDEDESVLKEPLPPRQPLEREDNDLRLRAQRAQSKSVGDDDDELLSGQTLPDADNEPDRHKELVVDAEPDIVRLDATAVAPKPAHAAKPEWIVPRFFVNAIIPQPMSLHSLYGSVEKNFPDTEYGQRAAELKRGLIAYREELIMRSDSMSQAQDSSPVEPPSIATAPDTSLVRLDN